LGNDRKQTCAKGDFVVRTLALKLLILALAVVTALTLVPAVSASSFNITSNNLGLSGTLGTVTTTQSGSSVVVTITMNPGYAIVSQGGFLGLNTTGGVELRRWFFDQFQYQQHERRFAA